MIDQERMVLDRDFNFIYDGRDDLIEGMSRIREQIRTDTGHTVSLDDLRTPDHMTYWSPYRGYAIWIDFAYTHAEMVEMGLLDPEDEADTVKLDPKVWGWLMEPAQ